MDARSYTQNNVPAERCRKILPSRLSTNSISAGTPVTLSLAGKRRFLCDCFPQMPAPSKHQHHRRAPRQSTIYTLYATNAYGRTSAPSPSPSTKRSKRQQALFPKYGQTPELKRF